MAGRLLRYDSSATDTSSPPKEFHRPLNLKENHHAFINRISYRMLDQCSDLCGWTSAILAALSFGSFGVPIKLISNVKVDPMVMQVSSTDVLES